MGVRRVLDRMMGDDRSADHRTNAPARGGGRDALDALLAGYVAGALDPYLHALIESHLILSPVNRPLVRVLEEAAGEELERIAPAPLDRAARDQVLAAIYAGGWYGRPHPPKRDPDVPEPLARLMARPLSETRWTWRMPGLREHVIHRSGGVTASLLKIKPGGKTPRHTHAGIEATLVLKGAFSDASGHYRRGDISVADGSIDHRPVADPGEDCFCFAVTDAPLRLTGPVGRMLQKAFGG